MDQNRKSRMESAEGSRDTALDSESSGGSQQRSRERTRNREASSDDLGTSSDRAMLTGRSAEGRNMASESGTGASSPSSVSSERGSGRSMERNLGSSRGRQGGSNTGGITNRGMDREQCEQEQVPERGRSQSEG